MNKPAQQRRRTAIGFGLAMGATAVVAALRAPNGAAAPQRPPLDLQRLFPERFAQWSVDAFADVFVRPAEAGEKIFGVYDQVLERIYREPGGAQMMLCVAYGGRQIDGLNVHLPEGCYRSAGFEVSGLTRLTLALADRQVAVSRLHAQTMARSEPITYWTVYGDTVESDPLRVRWLKLRAGLAGRVLDGMLVRVSSLDRNIERAYALQTRFADALASAIDPVYRSRVIGA